MARTSIGQVLISLALVFGGLAFAQGQPRTLEVAYAGTLSTWDPHSGRHGTEHQVVWAIFDSLIRFDASLDLVPGLAESWEFVSDTSLQLKLRPGLTFHDGTALNSEAVKWNIERQQDPSVGAVTIAEVAAINEVEVIDELTVVFHLNEPSASLPAILTDRAGMMLSPTAAELFGEDIGQHPVGAGPYRFVEQVADSHWVLEKFQDFWDADNVDIDRIRFNRFANATVAMQAVRSGAIHYFQGIAADDLAWVESSPDYEVQLDPTIAFYMLYMDSATAPANNQALRQAVAYALDRQLLAEVFGGGSTEVANGLWPASYWAQSEDVTFVPYDPELAAAKLQEAYDSGYDGTPIELLVYSTGIYPGLGEAIYGMLLDAGLNATISIGDNAAQSALFEEGGYLAKLSSWTGRTDPDQTATNLLRSDGGYRLPRGKYTVDTVNGELNALIDNARQLYDPAERRAVYRDIQLMNTEYVFQIPLYFIPLNAAAHKDIVAPTNLLGKPLFREFAWRTQE